MSGNIRKVIICKEAGLITIFEYIGHRKPCKQIDIFIPLENLRDWRRCLNTINQNWDTEYSAKLKKRNQNFS